MSQSDVSYDTVRETVEEWYKSRLTKMLMAEDCAGDKIWWIEISDDMTEIFTGLAEGIYGEHASDLDNLIEAFREVAAGMLLCLPDRK